MGAATCGVLGRPVEVASAVDTPASIQVKVIDGAWWFVKPDGERFISLGVNCVDPGLARDNYEPSKPAYAAFRHYDSTDAWAEDTMRRLKTWNFNTVGGWSHPAIQRGKMPYISVLHLGSYTGVPWNDLFAADFDKQIERLSKQFVTPHRDDPQLLGWCSDNELGWYPDTLFTFHLSQPAESKTRQRLLKLLKEHYEGDFVALTRDFISPGIDTFEELEKGGTLQAKSAGAARAVILEFTRLLAERYYQVVHQAIRHVDPNHLILGDRYASYCPAVVAEVAGPYVDVITTNYDWPASTDGFLPPQYLRRLHALSDRPVLVTEYYVAAAENRSGNPNTGNIFTTVPTQQQRAAAVDHRLRQLIHEPYLVGAHWFQFADEPPGGRSGDGEDYNFGLIDIENRPYEEVAAVMTDLNGRAAAIHALAGSDGAAVAPAMPTISIPHAKAAPLEGVANWDKRGDVPPQAPAKGATDLLACWDADHVYIAVMGLRFIDSELYPDHDRPDEEFLKLSLGASDEAELVCIRFGVGNKAVVDDPRVECRAWQEGVRYTAIAALPAAIFGKTTLQTGDELELRASIVDRRDNLDTRWKTTLQLD